MPLLVYGDAANSWLAVQFPHVRTCRLFTATNGDRLLERREGTVGEKLLLGCHLPRRCLRISSKICAGVCWSVGLISRVNSTTLCIEMSIAIRSAAACSATGYSSSLFRWKKSFHRFTHNLSVATDTSPCSLSIFDVSMGRSLCCALAGSRVHHRKNRDTI